ncbi:MAG: rod shape-determining protein MreC [Chlorobi bacterium]|nr:rod shape-determining protein MreC [Chlorobiota bacterium]
MRNLIRILIRYHFAILFLILEVFSLTIYFNSNQNHKNKILNSSHAIVAEFYSLSSSVFQYFNLSKVNYQLNEENTRLKSELKNSYHKNSVNILEIYDSLYSKKYIYRTAKVINNSINKQHNYITLNKGSRQGVKPEMAVVSTTGIVGIVNEVSPNYATVISILNTKLNISAKIKRNNYFGRLNWGGNDYMHVLLNEIPNHVEKQIGDTIVTSGFSTIFPEGILIGTISNFNNDKKGNFYEIEVQLSTDFKNLAYVYIVENLFKNEQIKLEKR